MEIVLKLSQISFIQNNRQILSIPINWFEVNVNVRSLSISDFNILSIEQDAFNAEPFLYLEELILANTPIASLNQKTFSGLKNLQILTLTNTKIHNFEQFVLGNLLNLESFTMTRCINKQISLDNLFGTAKMNKLLKVHVSNCYLNRTISQKTFIGLAAITELNLVSNHIEEIGVQSFHPIFKTLEYLYLGSNSLRTVPNNVFHAVLGSNINIFLENNDWHCTCELENLRQIASRKKLIKFNEIICKTPESMAGVILNSYNISLCFSAINLPTMETYEKSPPPVIVKPIEVMEDPIDTNKIDDKNKNVNENTDKNDILDADIPDKDDDQISDSLPNGVFFNEKNTDGNVANKVYCDISSDEFGDNLMEYVTFTSAFEQNPPFQYKNGKLVLSTSSQFKNYVYVGYEQCTPYRKYKKIARCMGNFNGTTKKIEIELKSNQLYRFCQMGKKDQFVKPLQCISIFSRPTIEKEDKNGTNHSNEWLRDEHKTVAITCFTLTAVFMPFFGIFIAILLAKFFPKRIRGKRNHDTFALFPKQHQSINKFRFVFFFSLNLNIFNENEIFLIH